MTVMQGIMTTKLAGGETKVAGYQLLHHSTTAANSDWITYCNSRDIATYIAVVIHLFPFSRSLYSY